MKSNLEDAEEKRHDKEMGKLAIGGFAFICLVTAGLQLFAPTLIFTTGKPASAIVIDHLQERSKHGTIDRYQYQYSDGAHRYIGSANGKPPIGSALTIHYSALMPSISMAGEPGKQLAGESLGIFVALLIFFVPIYISIRRNPDGPWIGPD